ncbi:MAG TPA: RepB family DNA primase, partial [Lentisphaeria bacterium]|nr:RepB family DNA primase [Lentisphaeria bacterium]
RTGEAIQKQINALGVERFEVGIREAKTGQMMNREWSRAEVEQSAAWLKRMNAKGNDIYIRPAGEHGLVLVDDLTADKLASMNKDGFQSAARIETSPGNFQAWVKLSDKPLSPEERRIAAQGLAKHYGGDPNSADSRHYGRLAGFTNQKPQHAREGRQPYVLAHECPGKAATAAPEYLERIRQGVDRVEAQKERQSRLEALEGYKSPGYGWTTDPGHEYRKQAQRLMQRYGKTADFSRLDWMIATDMAKSGRFSADGIAGAIAKHSPQVESRKAGHVEDYARRTAEKAWNAPEVAAERQQQAEQARQAKRDRGPSLGR